MAGKTELPMFKDGVVVRLGKESVRWDGSVDAVYSKEVGDVSFVEFEVIEYLSEVFFSKKIEHVILVKISKLVN